MQCDICFRTGGHKLPFLCATDARNQLYDGRYQNAVILLEKDALDQEVTKLLSSDDDAVGSTKDQSGSWNGLASTNTEKEQVVDRTQQIILQADKLRANIESARADIVRRKALLVVRRSDLTSAANGTDSRRARQVEDAEKTIRMTRHRWSQVHGTTASSRTYLCGEAAKLYGLRKSKKDGDAEQYKIGGIGIMDLKALNTASPAQISTVLSHIVHLLMLSTHYLAIRLPADITLPHRDYPLPTIFSLAQSYKHANVPFPGTPGHSSSASPTASRTGESPVVIQPHPRLLSITKPLPLIAAEDPQAYGLFLEGATLLAYNIAWLCKSQGIAVGTRGDFDDMCNIGRNLYNLLINNRSKPPGPSRNPSTTTISSEREPERKTTPQPQTHSLLGKYSHGTAHSSLNSAEGTDFIRSWKLLSPTRFVDQLKSILLNEIQNADWEMLDLDEDGEGGVGMRGGGGRRRSREDMMVGMQSFMSMRSIVNVQAEDGDGRERAVPGSSGWMKLKQREREG